MSKPQKLPSGAWRVRWLDHEGKRQSDTFATEAAARAGLRRALVERDEIRSGLVQPRARVTLADAAEAWLKNRPAKRARDNGRHLDHHILPELGGKTLAEITPQVIEKFIRTLEAKRTARKGERNADGRTLKPATVANVLITLRKLMNDSGFPIKVKYKVPTSGYGWIREPEQVGRFLAECGDSWFRIACELAVYAGLRRGEVAGLRRSALDFERGLILVDRSFDGPVKSKHKRYVPMAPELASSLRRWVLAHPGALVVTRPGGEPIAEDTDMAKPTRRACVRAGVEPVTFHQLRHTFASHLAQRVPLPVVGALLGHANPITTQRYAHLDSESLARSPKVQLSFAAPAGEVVTLNGGGHEVDTAAR